MDAANFETIFVREVAEPALSVGFERWGKGLWFENDGLQAGLLRTESRHSWPFRLTLTLRHDCLRDFDDRLPAPRSRNPSEWPVKLRPSGARDLISGSWRYVPHNLGGWPADEMADGTAVAQLRDIGAALVETFPSVATALSPQRVAGAIRTSGESAWCERRWLEDYERHTGHV